MSPSGLDAILAPGGLTALFQPVVEVSDNGLRLHACETLVRGPRGSTLEPAEILFDYVRRKHQEIAVDRACVSLACAAARELPDGVDVSINVHAATLARDAGFADHVRDAAADGGLAPERVIVEIVEHAPCWADDPEGPLGALRRRGIRIALDDVGLGQSNYRMILDCKPDYFKIDRYFVSGAQADYHRRAVLASVQGLARAFGGEVVAEGVEHPSDLQAVTDLGIRLVQGHLFSPPVSPSDIAAHVAPRLAARVPGGLASCR